MKKLEFNKEQQELFLKLVDEHRSRYYISKVLGCSTDSVRTFARYNGIKYLQEHYEFSANIKQQIKELFETTDLSVNQIEKKIGKRDVMGYIIDNYSKEFRESRHRRLLAEQKLGDNNPMSGKLAEQHPNYKGIISDGRGYQMILKPEWYTGRKGCKHIYYHHYVYCLATGLTAIPEGYVIHHIDGNKTNNDINNLAMMTNAAHSKLHSILNKLKNSNVQGAETIENID